MHFVLCDDHRLFAEPLAAALAARGHDVVVTTSPDAAIEAVERHRPDMCVVDLGFPNGADGVDVVTEVGRRYPSCPVVILSGSTETRDVARAVSAGAAGFLRKDQPTAALFAAFDCIAAGGAVPAIPLLPTRETAEQVRVGGLVGRLTGREREVLLGLLHAEDTQGIARSLGVAPSTARTHLQSVLLKLGVHSRLQAVALVVGTGADAHL